MSNPRATAPSRVVKMPNWAAAPRSAILGLAMSGPKSVIAPTPMKMNRGNRPFVMPKLKMMPKKPFGPAMCSMGTLAKMPPNPMGRSKRGSKPFLMASQIRSIPTQIITTRPTPSGKSGFSCSTFLAGRLLNSGTGAGVPPASSMKPWLRANRPVLSNKRCIGLIFVRSASSEAASADVSLSEASSTVLKLPNTRTTARVIHQDLVIPNAKFFVGLVTGISPSELTHQLRITISSPFATWSPWATLTAVTVPFAVASTFISIFMASMTMSTSPSLT